MMHSQGCCYSDVVAKRASGSKRETGEQATILGETTFIIQGQGSWGVHSRPFSLHFDRMHDPIIEVEVSARTIICGFRRISGTGVVCHSKYTTAPLFHESSLLRPQVPPIVRIKLIDSGIRHDISSSEPIEGVVVTQSALNHDGVADLMALSASTDPADDASELGLMLELVERYRATMDYYCWDLRRLC